MRKRIGHIKSNKASICKAIKCSQPSASIRSLTFDEMLDVSRIVDSSSRGVWDSDGANSKAIKLAQDVISLQRDPHKHFLGDRRLHDLNRRILKENAKIAKDYDGKKLYAKLMKDD